MLVNKYVVLVPLSGGTIRRRESVALHCDACFMWINEVVKVEATQSSSRRVYARDQVCKTIVRVFVRKDPPCLDQSATVTKSPKAPASPGETVANGRV
jgi:hypothetical protein